MKTLSAAELEALGLLVQSQQVNPRLAALGAVAPSAPAVAGAVPLSRAAQLFQLMQRQMRGAPPEPPNYQQLGIRG